MNDDGGFDWGSTIMVGNEIAQQWYSLITQKPLPTRSEGISLSGPGVSVTAGRNTLFIVGAIVVAAILLMRD